jgi:hypothetical protein
MIGVVFIAHGAQKLFGAFGGGGLDATANAMAGNGLRPGMFFASTPWKAAPHGECWFEPLAHELRRRDHKAYSLSQP